MRIGVFKENSILVKHRNGKRECSSFGFLRYFVIFIVFEIFQIILIRDKIFFFLKFQNTVFNCFFVLNRKHEARMCANMIIHRVRIFVYDTIIHAQIFSVQMIGKIQLEIVWIEFQCVFSCLQQKCNRIFCLFDHFKFRFFAETVFWHWINMIFYNCFSIAEISNCWKKKW